MFYILADSQLCTYLQYNHGEVCYQFIKCKIIPTIATSMCIVCQIKYVGTTDFIQRDASM